MHPHSHRLLLALSLGLGYLASAGVASAAPTSLLLDETFEKLPFGPISSDSQETIVPWEGTFEREYGYVSVLPAPAGPASAAHGKTVALHDNTAATAKSASLQFRWDTTASVSLSWDVLVAAEEPFLGIHFVGNDWNDSAAIVILSGGAIHVQHAAGDQGRTVIGTYLPGQWRSIRLDLDGATKTFDAYLDGKKILSGYDWQRSAAPALSRLCTVADYSTTDHQGAAVLHLDNIRVAPLPIAKTAQKTK